MQRKPSASPLIPTLVLLVLAGGLGVIFSSIGRWQNLESSVPELIALLLAGGLLYMTAVCFVERFTLGFPALLVILLASLFFRLCLLPRAPLLLMTVTSVLGYAPVVAYTAGQPYKDSILILA